MQAQRWLGAASLAGAALALLGARASATPNAEARALGQQALKLFRAKKYAEACPLFERVTELEPERGSAFGDLGLCLAKLGGHDKEAASAERRAIQLSPKDPKTRKSAYFNLSLLNPAVAVLKSHVPGPTEDGPLSALEGNLPRCEVFEAAPGCDKPVWACLGPASPERWARFARDPSGIVNRDFSKGSVTPYGRPELVRDGDIVALSEEEDETSRAGPTICEHAIDCKIVWADACNGRVGIACDLSWAEDFDATSAGSEDGSVRCPLHDKEVREIALP